MSSDLVGRAERGSSVSEGDGYGAVTRTAAPPGGRDPDFDVQAARRSAASFGGGEPTIGDAIGRFVRRYGWRAYALPVLVIVTIVALATSGSGAPGQRQGNPVAQAPGTSTRGGVAIPNGTTPLSASANIALKSDTPNSTSHNSALHKGKLPPGAGYSAKGDGTFTILKATSKVVGRSTTGKVWRYDIEVENGIKGIDLTHFASMVQTVLSDPRSWSGHGVALQRVDSGAIDFRVSLTSSDTVRAYCGYEIKVETSCYAPAKSAPGLTVNRVVLNDSRWVRGAATYLGDINAYRTYMINHEDGHALGHRHAHQCLPGGLAPVMMQQTFGLKSAATGDDCGANPWPYSPGVQGAPGAEQADTSANSELNQD